MHQVIELGRDRIGREEPREPAEALGRWYVREHDRLLRFATVVCGDRYAAEDLVQDAFVRCCLAGADPDGAIDAYVRRAIVNRSRSIWRKRRNEQLAFSRVGREEAESPAGDSGVWGAIQMLSPRQRAVIALRYYEDLSEAEIARTLGISTGNVKKHADRARTRLRALLAPEVDDALR